ncbi:AP-4 complex subunit epsilon [Termitomyces sp. T112]|nr:AP-4 complex subunit epsilon [Termitomyces sp. T112]
MDVPPYISSGASSRAHYSLVRKVECADSPQAANQFLLDGVEAIRRQLTDPALSLEKCREHLITLLYCHMTVSHGFLPLNTFDFALSHAVTLAEAGRSTSQKRMGYLFCAEVMPADHELQLMLINTLRKDLEHEDTSRICLALENVVVFSNQDLIPAIQARLSDLLSHNSPHVRRRALLGYRSLGLPHADLLSNIDLKVVSRCKDPDQQVVGAALSLCVRMAQIKQPVSNARELVNDIFVTTLTSSAHDKPEFICTMLSALLVVGLSEDNVPILLQLIRSSSKSHERGVLRGSFALLTNIAPDRLLSVNLESPVHHIRPLLTSRHPNDVYLFLSCLECIDPVLWAGTSNDIPAVLDGWEVERIMQLLDLSDTLVRKTTLRLLHRVDPNIVSIFYSQAVRNIPSSLSVTDSNERALRFLEIITVQFGEDGELYARELKDILLRLEQASLDGQPVLEAAIDKVLTYTRYAGIDFGIGFSTSLLTFLVDPVTRLSQTMMVIVAALATEQCGKLSIRPLDILEGFASRLPKSTPPVKDACILAMLRVAVDCDEIPSSIINVVEELGHHSKWHLRQRCEQFVTLVANKDSLIEIVQKARSSALPDFLAALLDPTVPSTTLSSSQSFSASKLRYDAYDTPIPAPKLRNRDAPLSPRLTGNTHWDESSEAGRESLSRVSSKLTVSSPDPLSKPLTAGELTLAAVDSLLKDEAKERIAEALASRVDLISLDSPFVSETTDILLRSETRTEGDFESLWNSEGGDARGWFNGSVGVAVERMRNLEHTRLKVFPADLPPYLGDLKVVVDGVRAQAALRLRESDDDSCLWRLRCNNNELHVEIRRHLG